MKILQIIPFFTPERGGSVVVPYNLSRELYKNGHEVTLITTDFEFGEEHAKSLSGVDVISFKCMANLGLFLYSPEMKHWSNENIKNFDLVHIHNFRSYQNNIAHHYAKKYEIPYILQAHGSVLPSFQKQRLKKLYDWVWGDKILKDASKVIALTKIEAEQYKKMGVKEDKIEILPNGIDLSEYENLPEEGEFRKKYGIKTDERIVLYLGRIHEIKGVDLLVATFADLLTELNNVKLVIVGPDDGFLSALKAQIEGLKISDVVLFTGPLYGSDKLEAYVDADVYVLPSIYEIFGITILEACACGTPVVVTDRCGIADIVEGNAGYVVEYDKDLLRDAIFKILNDGGLKKRFGECGKSLVREEFGWNPIVSKIEDLYGATLAK